MKKIFNFFIRDIPIHIIMLMTALLPNHAITTRIRGMMLRPFFKKCGKGLKVASGVIILKPDKIEIGENVYIAHNVWINAVGGLIIEDGVIISPFSVIDTSKHKFEDGAVTHKSSFNKIKIGKGTWITAHCVITDNVVIENGVLVAANSVVTHNVDKNTMIGGVPAKFIKKI